MSIRPPVVETAMLIRKPVADVFDAFIDPAITTRFWFTRSSGKLETGKQVHWTWERYGITVPVRVEEVEPNERIAVEWQDPPCPVEWRFIDRGDGTTFVTITTEGFHGTDDEIVAKAIDAMGGFTFVLSGLKALLEHGVELNLIPDRHPDVDKRL